jgi:hypothetical protein
MKREREREENIDSRKERQTGDGGGTELRSNN